MYKPVLHSCKFLFVLFLHGLSIVVPGAVVEGVLVALLTFTLVGTLGELLTWQMLTLQNNTTFHIISTKPSQFSHFHTNLSRSLCCNM